MIELLSPAGTPEAMDAAIAEGADAVYLGLKSFNARMRSSNFAWREFEAAVESLHKRGKKIYLTLNTLVEEQETQRLFRLLHYLDKIGPDALIVQDFGVIRMVQEFFPNLAMHASTQMNIADADACNLLAREGVKRVVLSRELSLNEIKAIKEKTRMELEVFIHGALCVSESGLCLFSSFLGGKSANRGQCTQACRRLYTADTATGEKSGYFFSPYDLQFADFVPDLIEAGVSSFKIEGRMKSAEYVGAVTAAYRFLIDNCQQDKKGAIATAKRILAGDFARKKTAYFLQNENPEEVLNPDQAGGTGISLGAITVTKVVEINGEEKMKFARFSGISDTLEVGDTIRLHKKTDTLRKSHKIRSIEEDGGKIWVHIPDDFTVEDEVYLLQTKQMSKRYPNVLPPALSKYRRQPGDEILPILDLAKPPKNLADFFPPGFYVQVSTVKDLLSVQSESPIRIILELTNDVCENLITRQKLLPLPKKAIIIALDPFSPQGFHEELEDRMDFLVNQGFTTWIVNNPAHIEILKKYNVNLIAGPYLYTFNRWAVSFLENLNISPLVLPHEACFKNTDEIFSLKHRERVLFPIFSYPPLFRMRLKLQKKYDFSQFCDKDGSEFRFLPTPDGSFVLPMNPFSIIDKLPQLKEHGYTRFLFDFSKTDVPKGELHALVAAMKRGTVLPETTRFNWKEGFYDAEKVEHYKAVSARQKEERQKNMDRRGVKPKKSFKSHKKPGR